MVKENVISNQKTTNQLITKLTFLIFGTDWKQTDYSSSIVQMEEKLSGEAKVVMYLDLFIWCQLAGITRLYQILGLFYIFVYQKE